VRARERVRVCGMLQPRSV